jgi:hypothetical protein
VFLRFKSFVLLAFIVLTGVVIASAQEVTDKKPAPSPTPTSLINTKDANKNATAEQVAESSVFIYAPSGRDSLNQVRKTTIERGKISILKPDGAMERASYQRFILRAPTLAKEKVRLDQEFPTARYALVYNGEKIFGIFNDSMFTPEDAASRRFENQIVHGPEALLRYKENESTLELVKREKVLGVELFVIDVTDKQNRKTRFNVSAKTFRIMSLEYEEVGVKYIRRFYNYNYAQGTLFAFRNVLWAGDKIVEETDVSTISFGQRVDESIFTASS